MCLEQDNHPNRYIKKFDCMHHCIPLKCKNHDLLCGAVCPKWVLAQRGGLCLGCRCYGVIGTRNDNLFTCFVCEENKKEQVVYASCDHKVCQECFVDNCHQKHYYDDYPELPAFPYPDLEEEYDTADIQGVKESWEHYDDIVREWESRRDDIIEEWENNKEPPELLNCPDCGREVTRELASARALAEE